MYEQIDNFNQPVESQPQPAQRLADEAYDSMFNSRNDGTAKPVSPSNGGEKTLVCTPEDSTGLGLNLPSLELVDPGAGDIDPRTADARRRLARRERGY